MSESSETLLQQIQRYTIQERIGTGGMARVYRASDTALDRDVAVKVLHEHLADDDTFRARFEREAKFIASFNHPNIIQIFDYATLERGDNYLCYMVMTYLPGKTLKHIMDDNSEAGKLMPTERVLEIVRGIAAALDYAHAVGMVHRDVKPANILFDERGQAVLTDFGIARLAESSKLTQENVAVGTPAYMAPEQAAGESVDARTDIYAFGVILYELLAGMPPFGDDGSISVLIKHLNEPVPPLIDLDHVTNAYLDSVVMKALAKNPEDRYQTAGDMAEDLAIALSDKMPTGLENVGDAPTTYGAAGNVTAPVKTPLPAAGGGNNRLPLMILTGGLTIIVLILAVTFFLNDQPLTTVFSPPLQQPPVLTATPTLNPAEFRNFGGIDSMVEEDDIGPTSMTSADNMGFMTDFAAGDDIAEGYWSVETTMSSTRPGEITRELSEDERYLMTNSIQNLVATSIVQEFSYSENITIQSRLLLSDISNDNSGYGIVFHYVDSGNYGVFAVDGGGRFSIWFLEAGVWRELRDAGEDWTRDPAINTINEYNELRLDIRGTMLSGFVNGVQVVQVEDDGLTEGGVGVYLANPNREQAVAQVILDEYEVTVVDEDADTASSMTEGDG